MKWQARLHFEGPLSLGGSEMVRLFRWAVVAALLLCVSASAWAQSNETNSNEINLVTANLIRGPIAELIQSFQAKTSYKVKAVYSPGGVAMKKVVSGDAFDLAILNGPFTDLVASGNAVNGSATTVASVLMGVVVKKGTPLPDISTPEAARQMLQQAKSLTYPDPSGGGAAGVVLQAALKKIGMYDELKPKIVLAPGGSSVAVTSRGEAEVGFIYLSEINDPGVDIVGALPVEICPATEMVGYISSKSTNPTGAKALLDYLTSPEAAPVFAVHHLKPANP
jgi:molybdate transport system substrate-binding protein